MLFPVVCFSCGKPLSALYSCYKEELSEIDNNETLNLSQKNINKDLKKSVQGKLLDKLEITRQCCRSIMLTFPDNLFENI
tara:strand:- start:1283 stop:1522 length:240 start_codon:yes stop_codon:yes gene_type:complete